MTGNSIVNTDKNVALLSVEKLNKPVDTDKTIQKHANQDDLSATQDQPGKNEFVQRDKTVLPGVINNKPVDQAAPHDNLDVIIPNKT